MAARKILVLDRSEAFAQQVRQALSSAADPREVTSCVRVGSVAEVLENDGPFDALVA